MGVAALSAGESWKPTKFEAGLLHELNLLRANPAAYAEFLKDQRRWYDGKLLKAPGDIPIRTQEGIAPLEEAIVDLEARHYSMGEVAEADGLSMAAADHVRDTGTRGFVGHRGLDGSILQERVERYGEWGELIGEDIGYGANDARSMVIQLLVDDGVKDRGHRRSLLDSRWRYVGVACGFHGQYGSMCVIDFASYYRTRP